MIKLAIVGTGSMAYGHAKAFQDIDGVSIISACDVDIDRVNKFADYFNIEERYSSIDELLEKSNVDAILCAEAHRRFATPPLLRVSHDLFCI